MMIEESDNGPGRGLVYVIFEFERRAYPIGPDRFTIGRSASCDVLIREPAVSRVHAELSRSGGAVLLNPVGATPTAVNGVALEGQAALRHGDKISIGSAILTLSEAPLPLGVSIVERSRRKLSLEDIANRRDTITNPILAGRANPNQPARRGVSTAAIILGAVAIAAAYYFGIFVR